MRFILLLTDAVHILIPVLVNSWNQSARRFSISILLGRKKNDSDKRRLILGRLIGKFTKVLEEGSTFSS